jgi:hypothetical protein
VEGGSSAQIISLDLMRGRHYNQSSAIDYDGTRSPLTPGTQPHSESHSSIRALSDRVETLEKKLNEVKQLLNEFLSFDDLIQLRDIPLEQAKEEISLYFREHDGEDIGYEEIIENLKIDPKLVVRAFNELLSEGKIG